MVQRYLKRQNIAYWLVEKKEGGTEKNTPIPLLFRFSLLPKEELSHLDSKWAIHSIQVLIIYDLFAIELFSAARPNFNPRHLRLCVLKKNSAAWPTRHS